MSNAGQAALSIVGAAVGFYFGGPAGAAWGMSLGGMAGSALFPTDLGTVSGPRLNDLNVQTSSIGAPIPIVYGTYAISGNVIWSSGIIEAVSRKKQGGKGGPTQTVKTYTYSVNCAVGVCEGEIGGIRRIWADAKLIYDARPQLEDETTEDYDARVSANASFLTRTEIYLGTAAQLADPTIESFEGAGTVSAFRDLAYVVFSEFQLADYGNRVPNFRFEVASKAVTTEVCAGAVSGPVIHPWIGTNIDPRNPLNNHEYRIYNGIADDPDAPGYTFEANWTRFYNLHINPGSGSNNNAMIGGSCGQSFIPCGDVLGWSFRDGDNQNEPIAPHQFTADHSARELRLWFACSSVAGVIAPDPDVGPDFSDLLPVIPADATMRYYTNYYTAAPGGGATDHGIYWRSTFSSGSTNPPYAAPAIVYEVGDTKLYSWNDESMSVRRLPSPPEQGDGEPWVLVAGTAKVLSAYSTSQYNPGGWDTQNVSEADHIDYDVHIQYIINGVCRIPTQAEYSDETWWTGQYDAAVIAGTMPAGLTYGVQYPVAVSEYYSRQVCSEEVIVADGETTLAIIVADVCRRCGLAVAQLDVADLTESVDGYVLTRVMNGRDAISPLRSYGRFDCVESEGVLKWPTRGKAGVFTFTADDIGAHSAGESRPSSVEINRQQEVELPRRLRVHYAQTAQNYESGEQGASRLAAGDVEVRDLEVAVAMSDTKGARIAEVVLYDLWVSRNRIRTIVDHSWLTLEPADAGTMPIDGRQERVRIVNVDLALPGLLRLELVRDDDGVYDSYAVGAPAAYSGTGGGSIAIVGTAELVLLDLPLLRDSDDDAGYYAAVRAIGGNTWGGAAVYRSPDGGTTYEEVAATAEQATLGRVLLALDPGPTTIIDEGNELFIDLDSGELESVSEVSLLAGLNAAAIGADGRWEIIQFRDAVISGSPNTWQLTGLLRGRRGTEWAMGGSLAGDRFVLLDSALMRVPMNLSSIYATRQHKAVLVGTSLEGASAAPFAGNAVALKPFSVTDVEGTRSGDDLTITWIRRGRIGGELTSGIDIPLSEASEAYEVDVLDGGSPPAVLRTLSVTAQSAGYTGAEQTTDFGSPQSAILIRIYQLSATVGRGYATEETV